MDADLVRAKEDSIVRCVRRIESKAGLTLRQLLLAKQLGYDVDDRFRLRIADIRRPLIGLRNSLRPRHPQTTPRKRAEETVGLATMSHNKA